MPNVPLPYTYSSDSTKDLVEIRAQERDTQITDIVNSLSIVTAKDEIVEDQTDDNSFNLSADFFETSLKAKRPFTVYKGMAGTTVTRQSSIEVQGTFDTVHFQGPDRPGVLLKIKENAVAMFRNCVFDLIKPDDSNTWIEIENGAKVIFVGCIWKGTPTSGFYLTHTGANANVQVVASYAPSTAPGSVFGNSTLTAVI